MKIGQPVPNAYNLFAYIINGETVFGANNQVAKRGQMVLFAKDADKITIYAPENGKSSLDVLLIGGCHGRNNSTLWTICNEY